jgi:hypothetical protein
LASTGASLRARWSTTDLSMTSVGVDGPSDVGGGDPSTASRNDDDDDDDDDNDDDDGEGESR